MFTLREIMDERLKNCLSNIQYFEYEQYPQNTELLEKEKSIYNVLKGLEVEFKLNNLL